MSEEARSKAATLQPGEILFLENLRFYKEEIAGNKKFAQYLATLGDVYINDAFGVVHRHQASIAVIPQYFQDKMMGFLMQKELYNAEKMLENIKRPFVAIIGGAKVTDKLLLLDRLLDNVDHLLIGGGMAYTFYKALGGKIGASLVELDKLEDAKNILQKAKKKQIQILLPIDSIVGQDINNSMMTHTMYSNCIQDNWMGLDIGMAAQKSFASIINQAKTILWNGPMGVFEHPCFRKGTEAVAAAISQATLAGAFSLVGGGESVAAVKKLGLQKTISYLSTGGGALLSYLEGSTIPGIVALKMS